MANCDGKRAPPIGPDSASSAKRPRNVDGTGAGSAAPLQSVSEDASADDLLKALRLMPDATFAVAALREREVSATGLSATESNKCVEDEEDAEACS